MLLFVILFGWSSGYVIVNPPNGEPSYSVDYLEGDYCTAASTTEIQRPLVLIENVNDCNGTIPNVTGSVVFLTNVACPMLQYVPRLQAAGAVGVLSDLQYAFQIPVTQIVPTIPTVFCYGITLTANETQDIIDWIGANDIVTVNIRQPPTYPPTLDALVKMQQQSSQKVWDLQQDPCAATAPSSPSRSGIWQGVICDQNSIVTSLSVPFPINGKLPPEFCNLENITTLVIQDDETFLGFSEECSTWPPLTTLVIATTSMSECPPSLLVSSRLSTIDLSGNQLSGPLNITGWNPSLKVLKLTGNSFSGPVPSQVSLFSKMTDLSLNQNTFVGTIFDFTIMTLLNNLDLSSNAFSNFTTPSGSAQALLNLRLSFNRIQSFPQAMYDAIQSVPNVYIDNNLLLSLPDVSNGHVKILDASSNHLSGSASFTAHNLATLNLANNQISSISFNSPITQLDISNNSFAGPMTSSFSVAAYLVTLYMNNNQLTTIEWNLLPYVETADFSNNNITQQINSWHLPPSLSTLDVSYNNLYGSIPDSFLVGALTVARLSGNFLSRGSSTLLPEQVASSWANFRTYLELGIECQTYTLKDKLLSEITIDPGYFNYQLCRCVPTYYRPRSNNFTCVPCLPHALCPGREDPLTIQNNANILAAPGYFPLPSPENPTIMIPCRFGVILVSDPQNPCNPDADLLSATAQDPYRNTSVAAQRFTCALGYEGRLCSQCNSGWFRKEGRCLICNGRPEYPLFLIAIVLIFLGACVFFVLRQPVDTNTTSINPDGWSFEPKQRVFDFIPLILNFFQVSTIILTKLQSLDVVATLNSLFVTASFSSPQSGIGFECGLPSFQGFITQYLAVVIFPPILGLVLAFFFLIRVIYQAQMNIEQNWKMLFYQYIYGLFSMYEAIHFPLVTYVLGVFQCTSDPITGVSYLSDHPYLLCDSISPAGKVFPLLMYPIGLVGFFVCLGVYLHYAPNDVKESEPILQCFAFFYIRFKPDRVASGVFFIFLNFGLSLVVGLLEPNNDVFPTLIVLLLVVDFFFNTVYQPYLQPRYNKVRSVNDIVSLLLFVNNLVYSSTSQFPVRTASPAVIYIGLNVGMVLFFGYHLYRIVKIHRDHLIPLHHGSMDGPHRHNDSRKHLELVEVKARKHTNIDPPSTSHSGGGEGTPLTPTGTTQGYIPVTTIPPQETSVENSSHSLPVISEHDSVDNSSPNNSQHPLVFTENPLANHEASPSQVD